MRKLNLSGTCLNFCCAPQPLVSREAKKKLPRVQERRARFSQKMWTEVSLCGIFHFSLQVYSPSFSTHWLYWRLLCPLSFSGFDSKRHLWYVESRRWVRSGYLFSWFPSFEVAVGCLCPSTYDHSSCWKFPPLSRLRQMFPPLALSAVYGSNSSLFLLDLQLVFLHSVPLCK